MPFAGDFDSGLDGVTGVMIGGAPGRDAGFFRTSEFGGATAGGTAVFVGAGG